MVQCGTCIQVTFMRLQTLYTAIAMMVQIWAETEKMFKITFCLIAEANIFILLFSSHFYLYVNLPFLTLSFYEHIFNHTS